MFATVLLNKVPQTPFSKVVTPQWLTGTYYPNFIRNPLLKFSTSASRFEVSTHPLKTWRIVNYWMPITYTKLPHFYRNHWRNVLHKTKASFPIKLKHLCSFPIIQHEHLANGLTLGTMTGLIMFKCILYQSNLGKPKRNYLGFLNPVLVDRAGCYMKSPLQLQRG